jgi:hypothetical protein
MSFPERIDKPARPLLAFLDHFNARDINIVFPCWVAVWVGSMLIFIGPVLSNFGAAEFFAARVTCPFSYKSPIH